MHVAPKSDTVRLSVVSLSTVKSMSQKTSAQLHAYSFYCHLSNDVKIMITSSSEGR